MVWKTVLQNPGEGWGEKTIQAAEAMSFKTCSRETAMSPGVCKWLHVMMTGGVFVPDCAVDLAPWPRARPPLQLFYQNPFKKFFS